MKMSTKKSLPNTDPMERERKEAVMELKHIIKSEANSNEMICLAKTHPDQMKMCTKK